MYQVYFQLENLSRADPPYKSVAALNCVILGCANIWDLDRAYQTFEAIGSSFGLTPDIHSYNALMYAFGKLKKVGHLMNEFSLFFSPSMHLCIYLYKHYLDTHMHSHKHTCHARTFFLHVSIEPFCISCYACDSGSVNNLLGENTKSLMTRSLKQYLLERQN